MWDITLSGSMQGEDFAEKKIQKWSPFQNIPVLLVHMPSVAKIKARERDGGRQRERGR